MDPRATPPLDTFAEVDTPELVRFRHRLAGPASRSLAYAIDLLVRGVFVAALAFFAALGGLLDKGASRPTTGVLLLVLFVLEWGYFVFFEMAWNGASPGKRALHLRVVTSRGQPLSFADSVLRNLLRAADALPMGYVIGALVAALDPRFRRLGELAAGTMVIVEERTRLVEPIRVAAATEKELSRMPAHVTLSPSEREAIELFLRRLPRLSSARAEQLAELAAPMLARRLDLRYRDPVRFLTLLHARSSPRRRG